MRTEHSDRAEEGRKSGTVPLAVQSPFSPDLKERVALMLKTSDRWLTAKDLCLLVPTEGLADPVRMMRKKVEELKDEGCPIAALPGPPGPGYLWLRPGMPGYYDIRDRVIANYKARLKVMAKHLGAFDAKTARRVQMELELKQG